MNFSREDQFDLEEEIINENEYPQDQQPEEPLHFDHYVRTCPACGMPMEKEMDNCPYCGDILFRSTFSAKPSPTKKILAALILLITLLLIAALILLQIAAW